MLFSTAVWIKIGLSALISFLIALATTPIVKMFAEQVGAIDVPSEARRVHDHPIPRMGGLAIFFGFIIGVILFADITNQVKGILIGSIIIVVMGRRCCYLLRDRDPCSDESNVPFGLCNV